MGISPHHLQTKRGRLPAHRHKPSFTIAGVPGTGHVLLSSSRLIATLLAPQQNKTQLPSDDSTNNHLMIKITAVRKHRTPAPAYQVGQRVWFSTRDLPL
jgi:hypothetical protein